METKSRYASAEGYVSAVVIHTPISRHTLDTYKEDSLCRYVFLRVSSQLRFW